MRSLGADRSITSVSFWGSEVALLTQSDYCPFLAIAGMEKLVDSGVSKAPSRERVSVRARLPALLMTSGALHQVLRVADGLASH